MTEETQRSPFFSVIIPTYNRADLLRQALQSVLRQDASDLEVIVVDDGSKEDLSAVINEYQDQATFLRQENAGPAAARNRGAMAAQGEYLAFLDSDDVWFPWTPEVYREAIERHQRPSFVAGCPTIFRSTEELGEHDRIPTQCLSFSDYLQSGDAWRWFGVSSFVMRRDIFLDNGGFSPDLRYAEDADLALKMGISPGFVQVVSPVTFGYRQDSPEQLMKHWRPQVPATQRLLANEMQDVYPGGVGRARERQRIIARHLRPMMLRLLREGEFSTAWRLYRLVFRWHIGLGQWKFVLGFPAWAAWCMASRHRTSASAS